ncbi:MAG: SCO family protein [Nitrospiraceae bacterium]|nr:MAG: SCO family protein [Nitrospiraceae bacterium]
MKIIFLLTALFFAQIVHGHEAVNTGQEIVLDEKLGSFLPLDIVFYDEKGRPVALKDYVNKPTVIAPVYLGCSHTCPLLLMGLADVIERSKLKPGKDYQVLAVSFDEKDTPQIASEKKPGYLKATNIPFPDDAWRFLTGNAESINRFAHAAGFHFKKEEVGFSHPVTLIFLSPEGKIVRYLDGVTFLPFEFEMAVTEASKGRAVSLARRTLLYCMSYDSAGKRYVFNTLKVAATLVIITIGLFFIYLVATGKRGIRRN